MVPHALSGLSTRFHNLARHAAARLVLVGLLGASFAACNKVPLVAPAGTVITLVSGANVLPINGSTDLIAVLIENGTTSTGTGQGATTTTSAGTPVHNGTLVTFTTSLGKIEPFEARTNNGRVTVKLSADGRSGTAKITAFSGGASQTLDVLIGAAAAERVTLTTSASSVAAAGGTVTVTARVEDVDGNALVGVPVSFTTTAGTLGSASGLTSEAGVASTTLSTTVEATVTASAGGKTSNTATVKVRSRSTVTLTVPSSSVFAGAPASFSIAPGATVPIASATIDFGDGRSQSLGAISSTTTVVHFYESDGVFVVTVRATDTDGGTADASGSLAVTPFSFSASASPTSGSLGTVFSFSVTGIPTSVPIDHYEWNLGDGTVRQTGTASTTHEYLSRGTKTITVTVVPLYGDSKTATFQVSVT